jgi:hypothetical protein
MKEFGIRWRSFAEEDDLARGLRTLKGRFSHLVGVYVDHLSRFVSGDRRSTRCGISLSSIRDAQKMETTPSELGGLFGAAGRGLEVNGMTVCLTLCTGVGARCRPHGAGVRRFDWMPIGGAASGDLRRFTDPSIDSSVSHNDAARQALQ